MKIESAELIGALDWSKGDGLLPAVIQDARTGQVLMLGFMNEAALRLTLEQQRVTFFSRTKQRLWTKGESSHHYLDVVSVAADCDRDSLLVAVHPHGPTCHTGARSCFDPTCPIEASEFAFLSELERVIAQRVAAQPDGSYTARLWREGLTRMAQKVGEEGVEVALAAATRDDQRLVGEAADLLFHLALLLKSRNLSLGAVVAELAERHAARA
jgi:phosphoribosyl-AMP cyclohydrolase / phosphoribosyl-ATP pyrophosphohydrolase